jgi:HEAT repeat protein
MLLFLALATVGDKEAEDAIHTFRTSVKSGDLADRVAAVEELGRCRHEKVMKVLASCLVVDDKFVRVAAATSLGKFDIKKPQACLILAGALESNSKEPEVQVAIFGALQNLGEAPALAAAGQYIDHKNEKVAESAIAITGKVRSKASIDPLIRLMKKLVSSGDGFSSGDGSFDVPTDEQLRERARRLQAAASKALQSITRERYSSVEEWDTWWKHNAATFTVKP